MKLKQIYDFYEFAPELYNVRYEPSRGPEFVDQIISVRWDNRVHKECNSSIYIERFRKHGQPIPVKMAVELTKFPVVSGYEVVKALNR